MRKILQLIVLLKNFATGIMVPVLTLTLLTHGASISTISLLLGVYSFTVILAEFPSGVFADLCGRKKAFMLSTILYAVCLGILFLSQSVAVLCLAMILNGLGRAFSSGSIDALAIDDTISSGGVLVQATARLAILESAGLAGGALAGGFLSSIGTQYGANLLISVLIYLLLFFFTFFFVQEQASPEKNDKEESTQGIARIGVQIKESLSFMAQKGTVRMLFVLTFLTGFALLSVETYWQPALSSISSSSWLLGAVSFAGFFCLIVGSKLTEHLLAKRPNVDVALLIGMKALLGGCLILLVFQTQTMPFVGGYMLAYLFIAGSSVAENTLLNRDAPTQQRASILSLFSFVLQIGGLVASLCGYIVSAQTDFRNMWFIAGICLLTGAAVFTVIRIFHKSRAVEYTNLEVPEDTMPVQEASTQEILSPMQSAAVEESTE